MPDIVIQNLNYIRISTEDNGEHVLKKIQGAYIDWMQACGGKGRCTTCRMVVLSGAGHLSEPTPFEQKQLDAGRLRPDERLACQCVAHGDIEVRVPDRSKLPHLKYTD